MPFPRNIKSDSDGYTRLVCSKMLPELLAWWKTNAPRPADCLLWMCSARQAPSTWSSRARSSRLPESLGFPLKIHADEFDNLGGASLAARLGAVSADHLVKTSAEDIRALAHSDTVAVALPCTPFGLAEAHYTPAREILAAGGLLAIASDINPGTAWCESMQFVIALACRYLRLTPAQAIAAATINAAAAIRRGRPDWVDRAGQTG